MSSFCIVYDIFEGAALPVIQSLLGNPNCRGVQDNFGEDGCFDFTRSSHFQKYTRAETKNNPEAQRT